MLSPAWKQGYFLSFVSNESLCRMCSVVLSLMFQEVFCLCGADLVVSINQYKHFKVDGQREDIQDQDVVLLVVTGELFQKILDH